MSTDANLNNEFTNEEFVYTIGGVKVEFPAKAYPSQISMMDKIIRGCHKAQNCLLESPTGSGKTLALLCGALAWQKAEIKKQADSFKCEQNEHLRILEELKNKGLNVRKTAEQTLRPDETDNVKNVPSCEPYANEVKLYHDGDTQVCVSDSEENDIFYPANKKVKYESTKSIANAHENLEEGSMDCGAKNAESNCVYSLCNKLEGIGSVDNVPISSSVAPATNVPSAPKPTKLPKIYFGTRTHKQIAQVVNELRRTKYNDVTMSILSSRTHSCVVACPLNVNKDELCMELNDPKNEIGCVYKGNVKLYSRHYQLPKEMPSIWDMEDLISMGKKKRTCPYFTARELMTTANVIFCPYNYLIDPLIRKSLNITLQGDVLILDEAHNIEDTCREAASFSLEQCRILEAITNCEEVKEQANNATPFETLIQMLSSLSEWISDQHGELDEVKDYDRGEKTIFGPEAVRSFAKYEFSREKYSQIEVSLKEIDAEREANAEENKDVLSISSATKHALEGLTQVLQYLYDENYTCDFHVAVSKHFSHGQNEEPVKNSRGWLMSGRKNLKKASKWEYTIHFWCFNPGVIFHEIKEKARSIILTSGTLSPMDSFQSELGAIFPITLEANHVIDSGQCWVGSLCSGPSRLKLDGTFKSTSTYEFQDEIGSILYQLCSFVPHGILCFVPSYTLLDKLKERWHFTGLIQKFVQHKLILWEPRRGDALQSVLKRFYSKIEETAMTAVGSGVTGVLFVAVCRGKVSEGLDFADKNARLVVTIGIPFPHLKDSQVTLKKSYNDKHRHSKGLLNGNDWYQIQAYRALNQALGRCIRHRSDWGAILLLDSRFSNAHYYKGLSKWLRNRVRHHQECSSMMENLSDFFCTRLKIEKM